MGSEGLLKLTWMLTDWHSRFYLHTEHFPVIGCNHSLEGPLQLSPNHQACVVLFQLQLGRSEISTVIKQLGSPAQPWI